MSGNGQPSPVTHPSESRSIRRWRERWPEAVAIGYLLLVAFALVVTLRSLDRDEFDGLNNLLQIPLALPWWLIPRGTDHVQNAYIDAGFGALNAVLIYAALRWVQRRRRRRN